VDRYDDLAVEGTRFNHSVCAKRHVYPDLVESCPWLVAK
jgi:hypothetical protein